MNQGTGPLALFWLGQGDLSLHGYIFISFTAVHFSSDYLFADLIEFANDNSISITKTKDYRVIEK